MEKQTISRRRSKARVVTTNSEIDRAIARAKERGDAPLVTEAEYKSATNLDLLILKLSDGHRCVIPREDLQGLQSATKEQISDIEILGGGTGLEVDGGKGKQDRQQVGDIVAGLRHQRERVGAKAKVEGRDDVGQRERHGKLQNALHLAVRTGDHVHGSSLARILNVAHESDFSRPCQRYQ